MTVRPLEGLFRYHVASESQPGEWHLVDLQELNGNGWCNCPDFEFHKSPKVRTGVVHRCKHIDAARAYYGNELVDASIRQALESERSHMK